MKDQVRSLGKRVFPNLSERFDHFSSLYFFVASWFSVQRSINLMTSFLYSSRRPRLWNQVSE